PRAPAPGLNGGVVGHDRNGPPVNTTDAGDHAVGWEIPCQHVHQQTVLDPLGVLAIEETPDPFAAEKLPSLGVLGVVLLCPTLLPRGDTREEVLFVGGHRSAPLARHMPSCRSGIHHQTS